MLIREKIKMVIKRYPHILTAMKNKENDRVYLKKYKEWVVIDEEVKIIIQIIGEIIDSERTDWVKTFYKKLLRGDSDIRILIDCPVERGKYYHMKQLFLAKIYDCCIYRGLVAYEDILSMDIG